MNGAIQKAVWKTAFWVVAVKWYGTEKKVFSTFFDWSARTEQRERPKGDRLFACLIFAQSMF
jgi:hypothetical protein